MYAAAATAALAAGDIAGAEEASEAARQRLSVQPKLQFVNLNPTAAIALARGDLIAARRSADEAVAAAAGWHLVVALSTRARVAIALGEHEQAERDAYDVLVNATTGAGAYLGIADSLECLAHLAGEAGGHRDAARLFGAAESIRRRMGHVRFKTYQSDYDASIATVQNALGDKDFDQAWAEGAAQSTEEAIAHAQRGRGQRKRPAAAGPR